ncbi:MAG: acetylxylan esterase [Kiritimatiellae bacterium]|nr:acetylxylan esterase [Kiritimatiellia bacterium]
MDFMTVECGKAAALLVAASCAFGAAAETVFVQDREVFVHDVNYDKGKIPPYALEDPLVFADGRKVATPADWGERRREILGIFAREMYGEEPPKPEAVVTELADEKAAIDGHAVRRQYKMWFRADKSGPCVTWIMWIPKSAKKPVPVISFLNYRGNHELVPDEDIPVQQGWTRAGERYGVTNHASSAKTRGALQDPNGAGIFPVGMILARGYAVMSACYCEVSPDPEADEKDPQFQQNPFAYTGVFGLWGERDPLRTDNVTSLGAWAWALSRGLDLAERVPELDAGRAVVTGCSRLGKAALIAAARDDRFAVCVPNQTGGGGVPLAKRDYGENVSTENRAFTHWYCRAYAKYAEAPWKTMPFDQHLFVACIAPRALLVEGYDSRWFDTEGEYLAVKAASPVWTFLGKEGMPDVAWPDDFDTSAIGRHLGYVRRNRNHGISAYDWTWLMDFADGVFGKCAR